MSFSVYYFSHWYVIWQPWPCGERNFFLGEKNFSMTFCTGISSARIYRHKETFLRISKFWMILLEIIGFETRHGNNITDQNKWIPRIRKKHKFWNQYWLMSQLAGGMNFLILWKVNSGCILQKKKKTTMIFFTLLFSIANFSLTFPVDKWSSKRPTERRRVLIIHHIKQTLLSHIDIRELKQTRRRRKRERHLKM